jgi:hypothetical protein
MQEGFHVTVRDGSCVLRVTKEKRTAVEFSRWDSLELVGKFVAENKPKGKALSLKS